MIMLQDNITDNFTWQEVFVSSSFPELAQQTRLLHFNDIIEVRIESLFQYLIQPIRDDIKTPIVLPSVLRSYQLNEAVGGSKTSDHLIGNAADMVFPQWVGGIKKLYDHIRSVYSAHFGQLICYHDKDMIHISGPIRGRRGEAWVAKNLA